jgi:hypothetical protein
LWTTPTGNAGAPTVAQRSETVFGAAQRIDARTMTLQVIDGLKAIGASPSSTFVIPMEFTRLLGQVEDYVDHSLGPTRDTTSANAHPAQALQRVTARNAWPCRGRRRVMLVNWTLDPA